MHSDADRHQPSPCQNRVLLPALVARNGVLVHCLIAYSVPHASDMCRSCLIVCVSLCIDPYIHI